MNDSDQLILLSALQHYAYCPRQFALIYVEQVWAENYFTAHGNLFFQEKTGSMQPMPSVLSQRQGVTVELMPTNILPLSLHHGYRLNINSTLLDFIVRDTACLEENDFI